MLRDRFPRFRVLFSLGARWAWSSPVPTKQSASISLNPALGHVTGCFATFSVSADLDTECKASGVWMQSLVGLCWSVYAACSIPKKDDSGPTEGSRKIAYVLQYFGTQQLNHQAANQLVRETSSQGRSGKSSGERHTHTLSKQMSCKAGPAF